MSQSSYCGLYNPRIFLIIGILALAGVLPGCGSTELDSEPASTQEAPGQADAPLPLDCSDLDHVIELSEQIAANAGARHGRYPLVLSHGFFGFDRVGRLEYFGKVPQALREAGFAVYVTAVEPIASSEAVRGPTLGRQIACIATHSGAGKVNLIGHSQGGLDARVVASDPRYSPYVASVTTIATPHRGTLIADALLGLVPGIADKAVDAVAKLWSTVTGMPTHTASARASLTQLSVAYSADFNQTHPNTPGIAYFSWSGRSVLSALSFDIGKEDCMGGEYPNPDARDIVVPMLLPTFQLLASSSGRNDGLVSLASTKWGTFMGCVPADHLDQIGMLALVDPNPFSGFSHRSFFVSLAQDLERRGL